jgi:two-component system, NtrC family, sensor kinase
VVVTGEGARPVSWEDDEQESGFTFQGSGLEIWGRGHPIWLEKGMKGYSDLENNTRKEMMPNKKKAKETGKGGLHSKGEFESSAHKNSCPQTDHLNELLLIGLITPEVVHDLNNQLTGILGYAELLLMKQIEDTKLINGLRTISLSAEKCKELLANLLSVSRQGTAVISLADLNEIIQKTIDLRSCAWRHKQIEVHQEFGTPIPAIPINVSTLKKALLNLFFYVEEALEARSEERRFFLRTTYSPTEGITISMTHNGAGLLSDLSSKIGQGEEAFLKTDSPVGLGLSQARQWIDVLGGGLKIEKNQSGEHLLIIHLPIKKQY